MKNTTTKTQDIDGSRYQLLWLYIFLFICGAMIIAGISYLMCGGNAYTLAKNNEPSFSLSFRTMQLITMFALDILGVATYFVALSKYTLNRPIQELKENYITVAIHIALFVLWPLFTFGLNLPLIGFFVLCASVIVGIYTVYRYYNSSMTAGILSTIWVLWLMYMLVLNLAYALL